VSKSQPLVSVIIPTRNSLINLKNLLNSFLDSKYKNFEIIINDDVISDDNTEAICKEYKSKGLEIIYKKQNESMAQGRKRGVDFSSGDILLHLDSDMKITADLLSECVELIHNGFDALVIPEESFGTTFWAKCKWLEKKCYDGNIYIESLRCLKKEIYLKLGGHNEKMVFSEDKDLDIRVRQAGYNIGRTKNFLWHNEGDLRLLKTLTKKLGYSKTANIFAEVHPKEFKWQANPLNRYIIFLKNIKYLFIHPLIYIGMIYMKTLEYIFAFYGIILSKFKVF
jgi:glycosyltransferase involved in cell wall biosynthesis